MLSFWVLKNCCSQNLVWSNCNRNSRSVNFPYKCEFSFKKTYTKYELLRAYFSRILATDKGTNMVQNIRVTEQLFLNKITTDCLWNFFVFGVCMQLISNFTCKDTIFKIISITCFGIFLNWTLKKPSYTIAIHKVF